MAKENEASVVINGVELNSVAKHALMMALSHFQYDCSNNSRSFIQEVVERYNEDGVRFDRWASIAKETWCKFGDKYGKDIEAIIAVLFAYRNEEDMNDIQKLYIKTISAT